MLSYTEQLAYKIYKLVYRDKVKKFTWKKNVLITYRKYNSD